MIVIGFCGLPGSGKSTALEGIKDIGLIITMGDVIRREAKIRNLRPDDTNLGKIAKELRVQGGNEVIAEKTIELIKSQSSEIIFIDGVRSLDELNFFRRIWKFPLVAIITRKKLRYKRILKRARTDDFKLNEFIKERDEREISFGIKKLIKAADYRIMNNKNKEKLKYKTRKLILKIIGKNLIQTSNNLL